MRVLIACEFSGTVRDAFLAKGHDAWSCDLLPTQKPGPHLQCDVRTVLGNGWDLMIAFPPCTDLAVSGAPHFHKKRAEQALALEFVRTLMAAPIDRIAIENPMSVISSKIRSKDQEIQPWDFGHAERKTTWLWLKHLPNLKPTSNLKMETLAKPLNQQNPKHYLPPGPDRWALRSLTYPGVAQAMADQWSDTNCDYRNEQIGLWEPTA